jgi:hypothetical protein
MKQAVGLRRQKERMNPGRWPGKQAHAATLDRVFYPPSTNVGHFVGFGFFGKG